MTILCHIDDIEDDAAKGFDTGDRTVFAVRRDGIIYVYINSCPHIGIPLEFLPDDFMDVEKRYIICSNHGALFEVENGACVAGPCAGQSLQAVPFVIDNGMIRLI